MVKKRKSKAKKILIVLFVFILLMSASICIYIADFYHSNKSLEEYINQSSVNITEESSVIKINNEDNKNIGIIFYPGGKVEYTAYIPVLELLAQKGYTCFLQKMPANLAVFGINKANNIINDNKEIKRWFIVGHSLGGAMASSYASENSEKLEGIIFLGAYPAYEIGDGLKMLSIIGSKDKVINKDKYESAKSYAPKETLYKVIEGANHAYYGDYGVQDGDGEANITPEEQKIHTAKLIDEFIE